MKLSFIEMKRRVDNDLVLDKEKSWFPQFEDFLTQHGWQVWEYVELNGALVLDRKR